MLYAFFSINEYSSFYLFNIVNNLNLNRKKLWLRSVNLNVQSRLSSLTRTSNLIKSKIVLFYRFNLGFNLFVQSIKIPNGNNFAIINFYDSKFQLLKYIHDLQILVFIVFSFKKSMIKIINKFFILNINYNNKRYIFFVSKLLSLKYKPVNIASIGYNFLWLDLKQSRQLLQTSLTSSTLSLDTYLHPLYFNSILQIYKLFTLLNLKFIV